MRRSGVKYEVSIEKGESRTVDEFLSSTEMAATQDAGTRKLRILLLDAEEPSLWASHP
jgi:hypothetical protein